MAEKVRPVRLPWSSALAGEFEQAGFTPLIVSELVELGQVWRFDSLKVVIRAEGSELVWMATLGEGTKKHAHHVLMIAKRAGAQTMRFHIDEDERAVLRFWRKYKPVPVHRDEGFAPGAYRITLEALDESFT